MLSLVEAWFTLWLLTGASLPLAALILDSVNRVVNVVFKMVPLRMGVDEVGAEAVALGDRRRDRESGLQLALMRKVRMIVWAGVGLVVWTSDQHIGGSESKYFKMSDSQYKCLLTSPAVLPSPSTS